MTLPYAPAQPRAVAFIDGQNLFHGAREAFGFRYPNYDVLALATAVCAGRQWRLDAVRFYSGVPAQQRDPQRHAFWHNKLAGMKRVGIVCFTPTLRYRAQIWQRSEGQLESRWIGIEKGVDVRIALDVVRLAHARQLDVALIFSQDQDLAEAAVELRAIAREQGRWIKAASAFPVSTRSPNRRGINGTDWIRLSRDEYDRCLDPADYRGNAGGD